MRYYDQEPDDIDGMGLIKLLAVILMYYVVAGLIAGLIAYVRG